MKLERITIENFRQYCGKQRVAFAKDDQKRITIIHGINGAGKTSFFLAINWCLYGKSVENIKVVDNVGELMSKEAVNQAAAGETVRASVDLSFLHNGDRYQIKRVLQGVKQLDGSVSVEETDTFTMMRTRADGQAERINNPIGTMNSILPANVREYFLFDGEKIDNFAKPEAASQVKQAIYLVLKLEILERARRHLEAVATEYRKELKNKSGQQLRDLLEEEEKARTEIKKAKDRVIELHQEIESAERKIAEIDKRLREMENTNILQQQRDRIERELRQRRTEMEEIVNSVRDLGTSGYFVVAEAAIKKAVLLLEEKRARGEIPSDFRQQFIKDLIGKMICVCGRPFSDGSEEHRTLLAKISHGLPDALQDEVLNSCAVLQAFEERTEKHRADLDTFMRRRSELIDIIKILEEELDDVSRQLKGSPLEEISKLERKRENYKADIQEYTLEIGSLHTRMEEFNRKIVELKKEIDRARREEKREALLSTKLDLAQRSADAIGEMYQSFADDMREKIQDKTKEIFKKLVWKESHFQDVKLGPDFNLEVIDRYGYSARPELSAGERQVLSLSFIMAMSRISDEEAPLVMDTPFGRLSSHHRNAICEHLPGLTSQLVLFVTDEELRDEARQNLESRIGAEYRLEFDSRTSCTEIVEVR
ncbi:DNA sulfur modification protein DndD [Citrifermentans bremense]|uniref:DNA sulfur modification protein DndD n=1 Tax=Citrifermentans bremense TaxID=60035 RepID=UPI00040C6AFB|nr:DNA sulfur modification protein DndD [Citrifermentans bremense]